MFNVIWTSMDCTAAAWAEDLQSNEGEMQSTEAHGVEILDLNTVLAQVIILVVLTQEAVVCKITKIPLGAQHVAGQQVKSDALMVCRVLRTQKRLKQIILDIK